jgi:hypothetical protein
MINTTLWLNLSKTGHPLCTSSALYFLRHQTLLTKVSREAVELMRGAPLHIYTPRVAKQPGKNWRAKVQEPMKPELGHPRVWVIGDAMHAMLPPRYFYSYSFFSSMHLLQTNE